MHQLLHYKFCFVTINNFIKTSIYGLTYTVLETNYSSWQNLGKQLLFIWFYARYSSDIKTGTRRIVLPDELSILALLQGAVGLADEHRHCNGYIPSIPLSLISSPLNFGFCGKLTSPSIALLPLVIRIKD